MMNTCWNWDLKTLSMKRYLVCVIWTKIMIIEMLPPILSRWIDMYNNDIKVDEVLPDVWDEGQSSGLLK